MNYTKKYIKKTHYHLIDIKKIERNPNNSGVVYRLNNKDLIETSLKAVKEVIIPKLLIDFEDLKIDITEVNIYHLAKSRYKYIDITIGVLP